MPSHSSATTAYSCTTLNPCRTPTYPQDPTGVWFLHVVAVGSYQGYQGSVKMNVNIDAAPVVCTT